MKSKFTIFFLSLLFFSVCIAEGNEPFLIRQKLEQAQKGDYLVTLRNQTYTLLVVVAKSDNSIVLEEISVPQKRFPKQFSSWKDWIASGAPCHTAWVQYHVNPTSGTMNSLFSFTHQSWLNVSPTENIFSTLINLSFSPIPEHKRKKVGMSDGTERIWHPSMIVEGQVLPNIHFDAWNTTWPQDNSELSGKKILIYLPEYSESYPSYFPYWLQVKGTVGRTTLRIVNSGKNMRSPKNIKF